MSINESSATALVRFTGLGIICFNSEQKRGEVAVIRDHKHLLAIRIQQPVYQDGAEKDIVAYKDIATYQDLPKEDVTIEIKALGQPAIVGYKIYQGDNFDRLDSPDINDFRWIVHLDSLHGDKALSPAAKERYPTTKMYISNGLFYTHKLDRNLFFEKIEKNAQGAAVRREVFGNVGETVGVKLEGEEVSFTIRIGDKEETHSLRRVAGLPFRIEVMNMDRSSTAVYSDMPDYYKYLASPTGHEFELTPVIEEANGKTVGTGVNQQEFCHPIVVDLSSIEQL
jgi:hypothetical protein